ncbi:MAG: hypothetical protein MZV63_53150 [Marinilabiliales bacterium]|nr:hypothetical protein [Marinilabiliales bacterium]
MSQSVGIAQAAYEEAMKYASAEKAVREDHRPVSCDTMRCLPVMQVSG